MMNTRTNPAILRVAYTMLLVSGLSLFMSVRNWRAVRYYSSPVNIYIFIFLVFLYCLVTGIGLLRLKKWALLSLLVPGVALAGFMVYVTVAKNAHVATPFALVNIGFVGLLVVIPLLLLRYWSELHW